MRSLFNRLRRSRDGVAAVEMALLSPFFALLLVGFFDFGAYLADASAVEKGVRAGTMLAARNALPLSSDATTRVTNLVKTGKTSGGSYLVDGWAQPAATLTITVRDEVVGGVIVPVVHVEASVPYQSIFQGLLANFGVSGLTIRSNHEQSYVGT